MRRSTSLGSIAPLECSVCTDILSDPRALPCGHSYCGPHKKCLKALEKTANVLRCALCNKEYKKNDLALNPLYGIRDFLRETSQCVPPHANQKFIFPSCEEHPNEPILFWCLKDSSKICQTCFETRHNGHSLLSYKKHLQEEVKKRLAKDSSTLEDFKNQATQLLENCVEQTTKLSAETSRYDKLAAVLKNGNKSIDACFTRNQEYLIKFSNDECDMSLQAITSFLNLKENLLDFEYLLAKKDTEILGYRSMELTSRFMVMKTWSTYEIEGSHTFTIGGNQFQVECKLPRNLRGSSFVILVMTWKPSKGRIVVAQNSEFYGLAKIVSSKCDRHTPVAPFQKTHNERNCVKAEVSLVTWDNLWGQNRAFITKDWTFDVCWNLVFNDPSEWKHGQHPVIN